MEEKEKNVEVETKEEKEVETKEKKEKDNEQKEIDKEQIINDLLGKLGIKSDEELTKIVSEYKQKQEDEKTDLQKETEAKEQLALELAKEKKEKQKLEAQMYALKQGAKSETVDDLVSLAMLKVTDKKDIKVVIDEMKDTSKFYFKDDEEEQKQNKNKNITSKRVKTKKDDKEQNNSETEEDRFSDTIAKSLASKLKTKPKKSFFSN